MNESGYDRVQNMVEALANIFRQKSQYKIAILLKQSIFPPVAPVGFGVPKVLRAIQFNDNTVLGA